MQTQFHQMATELVEKNSVPPVFVAESVGHLTALGVPKTIDQFQLALNAAFTAGKVVGESTVQPSQADAKDAERYRWIRRKTSGHRSDDGYQYFGFPTGIGLPPIGNIMKGAVCQHLDAAIDAAISKELT